jgi:hypothetical protein
MRELPPNNFERKPEHIPSEGEVLALFKCFLKENGATGFREMRKLEDSEGLYLWEIAISEKNGGGHREYLYTRKGDYKSRGLPGGSAPETAIHMTCFDLEGIPYTGYPVRKLRDGRWIEIS